MSKHIKLTFEPFEPQHLLELGPRAEDRVSFLQPSVVRFLPELARSPSITARLDGQIVACYGLAIQWPGVATVWGRFTPAIRGCLKSLYQRLKEQFNDACMELDLHRVQAPVDVDFGEARTLAHHLGFVPESVMTGYGPQRETYINFVWLNEELRGDNKHGS